MSRLGNMYKQASKLLPALYREQYGEAMTQMLEDMLADQPTWLGKERVWLRAMLDLPVTAVNQYAQLGGAIMNQMPTYAKISTVAGVLLLAPFFVLVAANAVHPLGGSSKEIGYIGIFLLPIAALVLSVATLAGLLATKKLTLRLRKLAANWAVLAVPLLALLIVGFAFGHDSVHCVAAENPGQIIRCVSHS